MTLQSQAPGPSSVPFQEGFDSLVVLLGLETRADGHHPQAGNGIQQLLESLCRHCTVSGWHGTQVMHNWTLYGNVIN